MDMAQSQTQVAPAPVETRAQESVPGLESNVGSSARSQGPGARNPRSVEGQGSRFQRQLRTNSPQNPTSSSASSSAATADAATSTTGAPVSTASTAMEAKGPTGDRAEDTGDISPAAPTVAGPAPRGPAVAGASAGDPDRQGPPPRGPETGNPPKIVKMKGETGAVDVKSGTLNLRDGPSQDGKVLEKLPKGTVVTAQARQGNWMQVKAWSEFGGKEGWILASAFRSEPDLTLHSENHHEEGTEPEPLVYKEVIGKPFVGNPSAKDAEQGGIGDCFLIAAMGAVAESRPDIIKKMIQPNKPSKSYTVTFYEVQRNGTYKPTAPIKVDAWFPTKDGKFQYTLQGTSISLDGKPLWPAIVEKAYAQWQGGYDKLDQGGWSGDVMSAMVGADSVPRDPQDYKPAELSDLIKKAHDAGKAMTAYTPAKEAMKSEKAFTGLPPGPLAANLDTEVVKDSLSIADEKGKAGRVTDDKEGKLSGGGAEGTVNHSEGKVSVRWTDSKKAPAAAADLTASYESEYWLSKTPPIVANHAYVVKGVDDKGLIELHNPWGSYHPGKVTPELFQKHYESMDEVAPPKSRPRA